MRRGVPELLETGGLPQDTRKSPLEVESTRKMEEMKDLLQKTLAETQKAPKIDETLLINKLRDQQQDDLERISRDLNRRLENKLDEIRELSANRKQDDTKSEIPKLENKLHDLESKMDQLITVAH